MACAGSHSLGRWASSVATGTHEGRRASAGGLAVPTLGPTGAHRRDGAAGRDGLEGGIDVTKVRLIRNADLHKVLPYTHDLSLRRNKPLHLLKIHAAVKDKYEHVRTPCVSWISVTYPLATEPLLREHYLGLVQ